MVVIWCFCSSSRAEATALVADAFTLAVMSYFVFSSLALAAAARAAAAARPVMLCCSSNAAMAENACQRLRSGKDANQSRDALFTAETVSTACRPAVRATSPTSSLRVAAYAAPAAAATACTQRDNSVSAQ